MTNQTVESVVDEQVWVVDAKNDVIGAEPRSVMRSQKLCHRVVYVFVFDRDGALHVQERTLNKDIYPGGFDLAAGGVVAEGETYAEAAQRKLAEGLGIHDAALEQHFYFFFHSDECQVWGKVYSCRYDGVLMLQEEEVAAVIKLHPHDILNDSTARFYTPDSLAALERLMDR